jgi:hypothetical protein
MSFTFSVFSRLAQWTAMAGAHNSVNEPFRANNEQLLSIILSSRGRGRAHLELPAPHCMLGGKAAEGCRTPNQRGRATRMAAPLERGGPPPLLGNYGDDRSPFVRQLADAPEGNAGTGITAVILTTRTQQVAGQTTADQSYPRLEETTL